MSGRPSRSGEFELIARFFAPLAPGAKGALGLTDDAALIDISPGCQLVAKVDEIVAGVHFPLDDPPELVGRKALRATLSDLAAKGARPLGFLQAITLNDTIDDAYLQRYAAGLASDVATFGVPLMGGDTVSGPGPLTIAITALGEVERGRALLRSGAQPGAGIYVTGTIGDAALGLACLSGGLSLPAEQTAVLIDRYRLPRPRLQAGRALLGLASASLDISDGLVADLGHICATSHVAARLTLSAIPLSAAARAAVANDSKWWEIILGGGDDYELAFTVPRSREPDIESRSVQADVPLTRIGEIGTGAGVSVLDEQGRTVPIAVAGFQHR